ncbi:MAG: DUF6263 family protein [Planctomycetaceae bacterium]
MSSHGWLVAFIVTACLTIGCGGINDAELTQEELKALGIPTVPGKSDSEADGDSPVRQTGFSQPASGAAEGELKLSLEIGARFPIQKKIQQTLEQQGPNGPIKTQSTLSMLFAISIEAEEDGRRLMNVHYQRVRYAHDILGERVEYDSASPSDPVPPAAQVYHGLVNNGFRFWLGADNQIAEVLGFDEFLQNCVRHVPAQHRQTLLSQIVATQEDEGFSNFVDNSIGLLPYNPKAAGRETAVKVGQMWEAPRQLLMRPLPMQLNTHYTLTALTDEHAFIDIFGTISPARSTPMGTDAQTPSSEQVTLTGGHTVGHCVIFRDTGLPMKSRVERKIDMQVQFDSRRTFKQHKTILTTVEAFPTEKAFLSRRPAQGAAGPPPETSPSGSPHPATVQ